MVVCAPCDWFFDLVDFWVIKIKNPMILCARTTSRSGEQSTKRRSRSESMPQVCLFYSQNNKSVIIKHGGTRLEKFMRYAKVYGLFLLDCAFWDVDWLSRHAPITWFHQQKPQYSASQARRFGRTIQ